MTREIRKSDIVFYLDREAGRMTTDGLTCCGWWITIPNFDLDKDDPHWKYVCHQYSSAGYEDHENWRELPPGWVMTDDGPQCSGCQCTKKELTKAQIDAINTDWYERDMAHGMA